MKDKRKFLLVGGAVSAAIGLILIMIGLGYFFLTFFSSRRFDPISWQFLCSFIGFPFLVAGFVMCIIGFVSKRNTKDEKPSA